MLNNKFLLVDKIKLEILGLSSSQSQSGSFALVLGEKEGSRRLPIIIGMFEAQAIAIEIEKIIPNRPMTHDLFKSFAMNFDYNVEEIIISDLKEGVFFAKIICSNGEKSIEVDARPSDAIAIGLRFNSPIYTYETILAEAGIVLTDENEDDITEISKEVTPLKSESQEKVTDSSATTGSSKADELKNYSKEKLRELLKKSIDNEDYERAAKIRDELDQRD